MPGATVEEFELLDLLQTLVEKSLAVYDETAGRYALLETVRQYARDRLLESGESGARREAHLAWAVAFAEGASAEMRGPEQAAALARLEAEHDNLRLAMDWAASDPGAGEAGLRLTVAIQDLWDTRGLLAEGRQRLATALAHPGAAAPTGERARALSALGTLAFSQGDYDAAEAAQQTALEIHRMRGDREGVAGALGNLANLARNRGDYETARRRYEESLVLCRELGRSDWEAGTLLNLGIMAGDQGDHATALPLFEEARRLGVNLGNRRLLLYVVACLAGARGGLGDAAESARLYREVLVLCRELGDRLNGAYTLEGLASALVALGDADTAARLLGAAAALREAIGAPVRPANRAALDRDHDSLSALLGPEALDRALAQGRRLDWNAALAHALQ